MAFGRLWVCLLYSDSARRSDFFPDQRFFHQRRGAKEEEPDRSFSVCGYHDLLDFFYGIHIIHLVLVTVAQKKGAVSFFETAPDVFNTIPS